jgi:hypothetical protein
LRIGYKQTLARGKYAIRPVQGIRIGSGITPVGFGPGEIGLAKHNIGRCVGVLRQVAPDQNPVIPGIGDRQTLTVSGDAGGNVERCGIGSTFAVAAFTIKIGLTDDPVRCRVVSSRQFTVSGR